jgi:hypothetical protein
MLENPLAYVSAITGAIAIIAAARAFAVRIRSGRDEAAHRRWTEQQEARLRAGGPPWGWYVVAETRLARRDQ